MDSSVLILVKSIYQLGVSGLVYFYHLYFTVFEENIPLFCANSVDPDQTAFCGVRSGSTLFVKFPFMGFQAFMG